jgi:hypothetical protein
MLQKNLVLVVVGDTELEEGVECRSMEADAGDIDASEGAEKGQLNAASLYLEVVSVR